MTLPDFLKQGPDGEIRFVGSRIDLYHVLDQYRNGATPEIIALTFDSVCLAYIRKAIEFYEANRDEVNAYLCAYDRLIDEIRAKYKRLDVDTLRARLAERERRATAPHGE